MEENSLLILLHDIENLRVAEYQRLIGLIIMARDVIIKEKAKLPFHLNLISSAISEKLKETAHSRILCDMLKYPDFLESFLSKFIGHCPKGIKPKHINYPDKYRMDVSIEAPSEFIIVENKINDATEQRGQIFRYVSQALEKGYKARDVYVIYLNSSNYDRPSEYSTTEDGNGIKTINKDVQIVVENYRDDIVAWLEEIYSTISPDQIYLKSAILQYIDYLKDYFNISERYKDMNNKIKALIEESIFNNEEYNTSLDKIKRLDDVLSTLDSLRGNIQNLLNEAHKVHFQEWYEELQKEYPQYKWERDNDCDIHIKFEYEGCQLAAHLEVYKGTLYWSIRSVCEPLLPPAKANELKDRVSDMFTNVNSTAWWPVYKSTSYENGLYRFKCLLSCIRDLID